MFYSIQQILSAKRADEHGTILLMNSISNHFHLLQARFLGSFSVDTHAVFFFCRDFKTCTINTQQYCKYNPDDDILVLQAV